MNQALALRVLEQLSALGVAGYCICPGARNSPFIDLFSKLEQQANPIPRWHFFEERSAAFFALGRIKATGRPTAVVTTSGTAVGELLPAAMEAHYSGLPLVLLTADRPKRFRGSGAPQTAEQPGIFGVYSAATIDIDGEGDTGFLEFPKWDRGRPLHVNVCFDEPLLDRSAERELARFPSSRAPSPGLAEDMRTSKASELEEFLAKTSHPLVLVGALKPGQRAAAKEFLLRLQAPAYLEAHSGLREELALAHCRIHCCDGILKRAETNGYAIDGVLRIGGVPTLRLWRDLESLNGKIPVHSLSSEPFSGLSCSKIEPCEIAKTLSRSETQPARGADRFISADHSLQERLRSLLREEPQSEPAFFHFLSRAIPEGSKVYLGNSLPIREWDLAATYAPRAFEIGANRGLNGIDGQISTFYGFSETGRENWAIVGDLTALYDLQAPWILSQLEPELRTSVVVMNNGGGKIFERMFEAKEFQNPHQTDFSGWAKLWKLSYDRLDSVPERNWTTPSHRVLELTPDDESTRRFWKSYDALCKVAGA